MKCPHCGKTIPKKLISSEAARLASGKRATKAGGRPKIVKPCPRCGARLGVVEMRKHSC